MLAATLVQMFEGALAKGRVVETDLQPQMRRTQFPHLPDRDAGGLEHADGAFVLVATGQHHRGRGPFEKGPDQLFLAFGVEVGIAEQQVVAGLFRHFLHGLDRACEKAVGNRRNDDRDGTALGCSQAARHTVGDVVQPFDDLPDLLPQLFRYRIGLAQIERHGTRRDISLFGHIQHGRTLGATPVALAWLILSVIHSLHLCITDNSAALYRLSFRVHAPLAADRAMARLARHCMG